MEIQQEFPLLKPVITGKLYPCKITDPRNLLIELLILQVLNLARSATLLRDLPEQTQ
jgi:hypothetical protein